LGVSSNDDTLNQKNIKKWQKKSPAT
jgi:hypothetical protein